MPMPTTNPLHLYRAIFRETTYLFDQNARSWTQEYVRSSFRKHVKRVQDGKHYKKIPYDPSYVPSLNERHLLKRGRNFQRTLERANQGYARHLRRILQLTYGRKGGRKATLTVSLMRPHSQDVSDSTAMEEGKNVSQDSSDALPEKYTKNWKPSRDFMSIAHSQNQVSAWLDIRQRIKLSPKIAEKNKWGKPMPQSRVRNKTRKWYAGLAGIIMPPLPEDEWRRLKDIAQRKQEFSILPRRSQARKLRVDIPSEEVENAAKVVLSGVDVPMIRLQAKSLKRPHKLTPRFVSRFYARKILNHVPVAVPHPEGHGLVSKWDNGKRDVILAEKPRNTVQTKALFG